MTVELVDRHLLGLGQDIQADLERCQGRQQMGTHEVCQRETRVRHPGKDRTPLVQIRDSFAGEVVEAQKPAAVRVALQGLVEEPDKELSLVHGCAHHIGIFREEIDPGVDVRSAVVAVHHGHRRTVGRGDHIDLPVNA